MTTSFEVHDEQPGGVLVDLEQILPELQSFADKWVWHILEISAIGDIRSVWPAGMRDLMERATRDRPVEVEWRQLLALANAILQVIDCYIEGYRPGKATTEPDVVL